MLATEFYQIQKFGSCHLNIRRLQRELFVMQLFVQHCIEGLECTLFLLQVTHHFDLHPILHIIIDGRPGTWEIVSVTPLNRMQMQGNVKSLIMWSYPQGQICSAFDLPDFKSSRDFRMYLKLSIQVFKKPLQHRLGGDRYALQAYKPVDH